MKVNNTSYRTIWPDPKDSRIIRIIDQRHLPHHFVEEELRTLDDFIVAIRDMHVRGAGLIGATAGFGMYSAVLACASNPSPACITTAADRLKEARPTASNLAWAVDRQLGALAAEADSSKWPAIALAEAEAIADEDADFCRRIGEHGLKILEEVAAKKNGAPVNILTHCNAGWLAFVDYGSATAPIYAAHAAGIPLHVWVDETRPWLQGAKLTAWELGQQGVDHTLIVDNSGGHLMQHNMVDLVLVGTDRTTRTGDVANKIGTYLKALAAKDNGVPFYVALPSSTFDWTARDGVADIPIEKRAAAEILTVAGLSTDGTDVAVSIAPPHCEAANFAFDVTPARLVSGLITERGVCQAKEEAILALFPEHRSD
jgi:methylthioribose-1-phosphate isomerase